MSLWEQTCNMIIIGIYSWWRVTSHIFSIQPWPKWGCRRLHCHQDRERRSCWHKGSIHLYIWIKMNACMEPEQDSNENGVWLIYCRSMPWQRSFWETWTLIKFVRWFIKLLENLKDISNLNIQMYIGVLKFNLYKKGTDINFDQIS